MIIKSDLIQLPSTTAKRSAGRIDWSVLILLLLVCFCLSPQVAFANKFRLLFWQEAIGSHSISSNFKKFEPSSGSSTTNSTDYYGSALTGSETKINRLVSYHYLVDSTYAIGYTEMPFRLNVKLADGRSYGRDMRLNELDLGIGIGGSGSGISFGKGFNFMGEDGMAGDSSFIILSYSPRALAKMGVGAAKYLPKLRSMEILLGYRAGKYDVSKEVGEVQSGTEVWTVDYQAYQIGFGARF